MRIDTTLNIHESILMQIESTSKIYGKTANEIIIRLLQRAMKEYSTLYYKGSRRVKYQERDMNKRWNPKHVIFSEIEHECVQDMKKLYKMSISNILAFAVKNFLKNEIYEMKQKKIPRIPDNYRLSGYAVVMELVENVICWKFYWGIPPNLSILIP